MSARLTWSKEPSEKGLAAVCQGERGRILKVNGSEVGYAGAVYQGWSRVVAGYYWYASDGKLGIAHRNTADSPVATLEDAQKACEAYVRECLKLPPKKPR